MPVCALADHDALLERAESGEIFEDSTVAVVVAGAFLARCGDELAKRGRRGIPGGTGQRRGSSTAMNSNARNAAVGIANPPAGKPPALVTPTVVRSPSRRAQTPALLGLVAG